MNFADKFENVIPTRKEKEDLEGLCMLFTDKSRMNENDLGIYEVSVNEEILWMFLMENKLNFMKINKDMSKIINLKTILKRILIK